ncbi:hypothetical protein Q3G72_011980 [Acer saccharum]|nr:hypothetical protein Q3G72_011980 [Acer saccharum]
MAAISHYCGRAAVKDKVAEFIYSSPTKSAYMQTYVGMIHPIPDQRRKDNQTEGGSVGASSLDEPNQTPPPQSQVTQQLFD